MGFVFRLRLTCIVMKLRHKCYSPSLSKGSINLFVSFTCILMKLFYQVKHTLYADCSWYELANLSYIIRPWYYLHCPLSFLKKSKNLWRVSTFKSNFSQLLYLDTSYLVCSKDLVSICQLCLLYFRWLWPHFHGWVTLQIIYD